MVVFKFVNWLRRQRELRRRVDEFNRTREMHQALSFAEERRRISEPSWLGGWRERDYRR